MATENSKIVYGGDLMLFVGTGITKNPLAFSTNAALEVNRDTREITSKDSGNWKDFNVGQMGWTASTDGLVAFSLTASGTTSIDQLYVMKVAGELVNLAFGVKSGTSPDWTLDESNKYFTGSAYITSISLSGGNNDNATYSISLQGTGELSLN